MKADDVKRTVELAIKNARIKTKAKPTLLSDNGACYISSELGDYLKTRFKCSKCMVDLPTRKIREKLNAISGR